MTKENFNSKKREERNKLFWILRIVIYIRNLIFEYKKKIIIIIVKTVTVWEVWSGVETGSNAEDPNYKERRNTFLEQGGSVIFDTLWVERRGGTIFTSFHRLSYRLHSMERVVCTGGGRKIEKKKEKNKTKKKKRIL